MIFTSCVFLFGMFPWFVALSVISNKTHKGKTILLLITNTIFYVLGGIGSFIILLLFSIIVWICQILINRVKKIWSLYLSIAIVIIPLLFYKYVGTIVNVINFEYVEDNCKLLNYLPMGVSFFTFEAISLLCDSYNGLIEGKLLFIEVYSYLSFFPTIVSGPILRYKEYSKGVLSKHAIDYVDVFDRLILGISKKILIADKLAPLVNYYFDGIANGQNMSTAGLWLGSIAYSLQLYFDFSGYSDIAIAIAKLVGVEIGNNFNSPYLSKSISNFWKRWHISLSKWFRDYVYIPMGGNRCHSSRNIINIVVVWILTGIWHGADLKYIIWGMGHCLLLLFEKFCIDRKKLEKKWYCHLYTLSLVNILWIPFRADDISSAVAYIVGLFAFNKYIPIEHIAIRYIPLLIAIISFMLLCPRLKKYEQNSIQRLVKNIVIIGLSVWSLSAIINASYTPYIYGKF